MREDITSKGVHNKAAQKLHAFKERMMKNAEYYNSNQLITANFDFLKLVKVKDLFLYLIIPCVYDTLTQTLEVRWKDD